MPEAISTSSDPIARSADELRAAISSGAPSIHIEGRIPGLRPLALGPGQSLRGLGAGAELIFEGDGLALSADNAVHNLRVTAPRAARSISLADGHTQRGELVLSNLICTGQVQLIFAADTEAAKLSLHDVTVPSADATARAERPHGNGVDVLQGALTIWNRAAADITVPLSMSGVTIGAPDAPVGGTGLFIHGVDGEGGGKIAIGELQIGAVYADSMLPPGTTEVVSGGVFVLGGVSVERITGSGPVVTHGANAVPVDNWGDVKLWRMTGDAISHGPSAIGFINAGVLGALHLDGAIETFGDGARGCGIYGQTGTLRARAIRTHGPAAVGVQVLASLEALELSEGVFTQGAPGEGLVKGVMMQMPAHAIHIEEGGQLGRIDANQISATGEGAETICNEGQLGS